MTETKTNRNFKSGILTMLLEEPSALLETYNAVTGQSYPPDTQIEIITLSDVLFMGRLNDIAFVIEGKLVVLIEHQSTVNENMALRMLLYMAREYERITDSENLYVEKRIEIPAPDFIVLYNGKDEYPDFKEIRLSDSFAVKTEACALELVVKVYNINKGRNAGIVGRSSALSGYIEFVAEVNKNLETMGRSEAIKAAVRSCMGRDILLSFFKKHGSEVENMLLTEWNWEDAKRVWQKESRAEGRKEGKAEGVAIGRGMEREELFALWESGMPLAEAKRKLGV